MNAITISPGAADRHAIERADLIGRVIWGMVGQEVERKSGRTLMLLAGLKPEHLAGVARHYPVIKGKTVTLAISREVDPTLAQTLDARFLTDRPGVSYRNSDEADIVLFAVSDKQRDTVGASLNAVTRVDRRSIQDKSDLWLAAILEGAGDAIKGDEHRTWISAMLAGLDAADVTKDLDQFAEFVRSFMALKEEPLDNRLRKSAPALKLPMASFGAIPVRGQPKAKLVADFKAMFRNTYRDLSDIPYLLDAKSVRMPVEPILDYLAVREGEFKAEEKVMAEAIAELIADRKHLRHGEWRPSQRRFCEVVEWNDFGKNVFAFKARKQTPSLVQRTRTFIENEYPARLKEPATSEYLERLEGGSNTPEQDQEFFNAWQDQIRTVKDKKLYESWRRHLFTDEVKETDLLSLIVKGVRSLLIKNAEDGMIVSDAEVIVKIKNGEKTSAWTDLNPRLVKLLRLEGQLVQDVLADHVTFEFGKWLTARGEARSQSAGANQIEFELRLKVEDDIAPAQVRLFWQPGASSIALAWPEDIEAFGKAASSGTVRVVTGHFDLKQGAAVGGIPASLTDTTSFIDIGGGEAGSTADPFDHPAANDFFAVIPSNLEQAVASRTIEPKARDTISEAITSFREAFGAAVTAIVKDPKTVYAGRLIENQAAAFGHLCRVAREKLGNRATVRETLLRPIVEFGLLPSSNGQAVIVPAWHPLRLLERKAKARDLAEFIRLAIGSQNTSVDGLERATEVQRSIFVEWFFPKVVSYGLQPFATVEDCAGYSLAVPVNSRASSEQKLEATAGIACREFMLASDKFIELNPHEEGNFSAALYNADAVSLAGLVAKDLEKRMSKKGHLRASLLITHDSSSQLREVYTQQNARLSGENLDEVTEGFLSRLRVGVGRGDPTTPGRRSNIDVVFLHDAFFKHARMAWELVDGASEDVGEEIDFRNASLPRRRTDSDAAGNIATNAIEIFMTASRPPRAVAQFTDLCFVASEDTKVLPADKRALPIQRVNWNDTEVSNTIRKAHELGEWVVSVDTMSSRQMLAVNGIKVIRDIQLPDVDMRVLVSSREPSQNLLRHLQEDFSQMQDNYLGSNAATLAAQVVNTVVEVCGQKILSSARSRSAAREIVGLAAATAIVDREKAVGGVKPVWFSLDDNRAFFSHKGKLADTLALAIRREDGKFVISMTVVEAKCVSQASELIEAKSSRDQVVSTLATIETHFVTQADLMAKRAWGRQLLYLMSLRPDYIHFFANNVELEEFRQAVADGEVEYEAEGRSIVVVHDDIASTSLTVAAAEQNDAVWQYTVRQKSLSALLQLLVDPQGASPSDLPRPVRESAVTLPEPIASPEVDETPIATDPTPLADEALMQAVAQGIAEEELEPKGPVAEDLEPLPAVEIFRQNPGLPPALESVMRSVAEGKGTGRLKEAEEIFAADTARNLQAALTEFNMVAQLVEPRTISTPNGVLVNFAGHSTLTVPKLTSKITELRTTFGLDVTDIRAGLGRISLFVAAQERRVVDLARVWLETKWPESSPQAISNFLLGLREDTGEPLWLNLRDKYGCNEEHGPHTLIAGETGSGKGVLMQSLLLQMVALNSPQNLKIYLIDPKMGVDFPWIENAPHMARDIITDQEEAEMVLESVVREMDRRYELIKEKRVPKISEYNRLVAPEKQLPYIFVIHDEMADWMASSDEYRKVIQQKVTRLAAKARACGIHVIMITQRAAQEAIPPGIRDNLNNRLVLKVAGEAGSVLALGVKGAERLLGKGHLAARLGGDKPAGEEYFVAQVPFASTEELQMYADSLATD
ncbi:FtsK/SpoIIIE domain-containing protein [Aquamicrobium segne]|uniref:FtsK/SpoIIIE domain-containing protein n=1 Tax=Aquamicrobium segne TaxID=469547 RepID=A0ABW0H156_9HYPH